MKQFWLIIPRHFYAGVYFSGMEIKTGEPKGSADFRREAGVYYDAIRILRQWAAGYQGQK